MWSSGPDTDKTSMNKRINLEDYVPSGEGGTAVTYKHKSRNSLAKLYNPGFEADMAREEFITARAVYDMGVPTPEPIRLVTDGQRMGAEYEFIPGKRSFARILSEEPQREAEIARAFAQAGKRLHGTHADTSRIPSIKDILRPFYQNNDCVTEEYCRRALAFLDKAPDADTCLHGDFHIGNIITDGNRTMWIDIGQFCHGVPQWDLGWFWTICHNLGDKRADFLLHMTQQALNSFWDAFLPAYLGTTDPQTLADYTREILPFYAVRVPYMFRLASQTRFPEEGCRALIKLIP
jgi:uncharacterized protein (TIGR02172 family)